MCWPSIRTVCGVAALLALYWLMGISAAATKSAIFDEDVHLTSGYSWWIKNDFRLDAENGALPGRLAALPLLGMRLQFPRDAEAWRERSVSAFGFPFFYRLGNPLSEMLLRARMAMAVLGAALGLVIFLISRRLWGTAGALVSLSAYVFDPNFLAHGCLATSDVAVALFFTLAAWTFWALLHRVTPGRIALAGFSAGALAISKMSAPIFVPVAAAMLLLRSFEPAPLECFGRSVRTRWGKLGAMMAASAACLGLVGLTIWAAYSFRYSLGIPGDPIDLDFDALLARSGPIAASVSALRTWRILPEAWLYGFASVTLRVTASRACFLVGEYGLTGFRSFFPLVFVLKTPLALLFLLGLAGAAVWRGAPRSNGADMRGWQGMTPLWILFAVYWAFAIASHLNIGLRHILPVYPPLFIFAGAAALPWNDRRRSVLPVAALLCWNACASLAIRPHYLAYMNELTGGPREHYRYLVDSSLDWGQDLPGLRKWLDLHGVNDPAHSFVSYFGVADLAHYGIHGTSFGPIRPDPVPNLRAGVYCISATTLQTTFSPEFGRWSIRREARYRRLRRQIGGDFNSEANGAGDIATLREFSDLRSARLFAWLRQRDPDEEIGYSILVFRLTDSDLRAAFDGPPAELE